jgi:hypothetical protein
MDNRFSFGISVAIVQLALASPAAQARDWFVRAGSGDGDGSLARPFADPWQALDKCEAGDAIHVTEGKYYGRLGLGLWKLPFDKVQLIGGYDRNFNERNPWVHLTQLLWDPQSRNRPKGDRLSSTANGVGVDGVVIDMQDQDDYVDKERSGRGNGHSEDAMRFTGPATVRNSVIINADETGIQCEGGSLIENNLILNSLVWGVVVKSGSTEPATIRNNTILFSWTFKEPGKGGYEGSAVAAMGPAVVSGNILAHNDNNGVFQAADPETIQLTHNLFFMNLYANLNVGVMGHETAIDDKNMDMLEEVGLKAYDGNERKDAQLPLDPHWMDKYSKRTAYQPGKLVMDDWNKMRQTLGLPLIARGGSMAGGVAPAWSLANALKLMHPKAQIQQGARIQKLEVAFSGAGATAAAPTRNYQRVELTSWNRNPESVDGKPVEMVVGIGSVANVSGIPSQYPEDQHEAVTLYDKDGKEERVTGFYRKGSSSDRALSPVIGHYNGFGVPDHPFLVRGVAYVVQNLPKGGLFIESVEPFEGEGAPAAARPRGRDWYVRMGSTGVDGSREKPFKDPYQALEKAGPGDTIRVAEGSYYGKLHAGNWLVTKPYLALVGGYNSTFTTRNPWKHPTLLQTGSDHKGDRRGYTIEGGQDDYTGAIIDGFIFDKRVDNVYSTSGDLDYDASDKNQQIWLSRPGCVIRNNVFVNGAEGALRVTSGVTVENNIFINHFRKTIDVQGRSGNDPFVFRHNTVAFAWDIRFGQGRGSLGTLLRLGGGISAVVDSNIFEFADNDAIRLDADPKYVELTHNVFSHNLWSNVMRSIDSVAVDDRGFAQLSDLGWKKLEGNVVTSSGLPVDKKWFDVYLNRTAYVPGKVTMDDWNQLREMLGQPVIASGGAAATGLMPALDWKEAVALFPKNPRVTAGARAVDLPVQ